MSTKCCVRTTNITPTFPPSFMQHYNASMFSKHTCTQSHTEVRTDGLSPAFTDRRQRSLLPQKPKQNLNLTADYTQV